MKTIPILIIVIFSLVQENSCCFSQIESWFRKMWCKIKHPSAYCEYAFLSGRRRRNLGPGNKIIAISRTDCRYRKKPKIELFEIRENQLNRGIEIQPVQLQYDLDSKENESEGSKLSKMLSYEKKKVEDAAKNIKKIKSLKGLQGVGNENKKEPIVVMVSPDKIEILTPERESHKELPTSFLDGTRTQDLVEPGSEVVFNIVPPNEIKKTKKQPKLPAILRIGDFIEERTEAPLSQSRDRPYSDEY